jgi:hypothetical protein
MKKRIILSVLALFASFKIGAQVIRCESGSQWHELMKSPDFITLQNDFEQRSKQPNISKSQSIFVVPVVVHVLYKNSAENIPDAQILSQITKLNEDFRLRNADSTNVDPEFSKADVRIEFCLARRDPNGISTNGITRKLTSEDDIGLSERYYAIQPAWNPDEYLNIWVVDYGEVNGNVVLGRGTPPGHTPRAQDGVVINYQAFGTTGTLLPSYNGGRTTVHEVGHWLNLFHIWGSNDLNPNCASDDLISDTPDQSTVYFDCDINPSASCGSKDMLSNYMGYVKDECMGNFTEGQRDRMRNALVLLRSGILLSNGCLPVGLYERELEEMAIIYPIPANERLQIDFAKQLTDELQLRLFDLNGKLIHQCKIPSNSTGYSLNTKEFSEGIYFVRLENSETHYNKKIILQH